jgi:Deoxyribonuclease II
MASMRNSIALAVLVALPLSCGGTSRVPSTPAPAAAPEASTSALPSPSSRVGGEPSPTAPDRLLETRRRDKSTGPSPLVAGGNSVDWWFVFKFNAATFSGCEASKACPFGGSPRTYRSGEDEEFALASSEAPHLAMNAACVGESDGDPIGATFGQVYEGSYFYVLWNDQFYQDPKIAGCSNSCGAPWAHSKGMVAWGPNGNGFVMQVSTPSWPASGSQAHARQSDGNTLGCVTDDNVLVSQHFFSLRLSHADLVTVLKALANASVVTDTSNPQIVSSGGPSDVQSVVGELGKKSSSTRYTKDVLSTGVTLISKPSALQVPPWQMVSAVLGGASIRTATWWESHDPIPSTTASTPIECWDAGLGSPGAVEIATTGTWQGKTIGLEGGLGKNFNHARWAS